MSGLVCSGRAEVKQVGWVGCAPQKPEISKHPDHIFACVSPPPRQCVCVPCLHSASSNGMAVGVYADVYACRRATWKPVRASAGCLRVSVYESNLSSCLLGNRAYCHTTTTACQHVYAMTRRLFACLHRIGGHSQRREQQGRHGDPLHGVLTERLRQPRPVLGWQTTITGAP